MSCRRSNEVSAELQEARAPGRVREPERRRPDSLDGIGQSEHFARQRVHDSIQLSAIVARRRNQRPQPGQIATGIPSSVDPAYISGRNEGDGRPLDIRTSSPPRVISNSSSPSTRVLYKNQTLSPSDVANASNQALEAFDAVVIRLKLLEAMTCLQCAVHERKSTERSTTLEEGLDHAMEALDTACKQQLAREFVARCCYWVGVAVYLLNKSPPFDKATYWFDETLKGPDIFPEYSWAREWIARINYDEEEKETEQSSQPEVSNGRWSSLKRVGSALGYFWRDPVASPVSQMPLKKPPRPISQSSDSQRPRSSSIISVVEDQPLQRIPSFRSIGSQESIPTIGAYSPRYAFGRPQSTGTARSTYSSRPGSAISQDCGSPLDNAMPRSSSKRISYTHDDVKGYLHDLQRSRTSGQHTPQ